MRGQHAADRRPVDRLQRGGRPVEAQAARWRFLVEEWSVASPGGRVALLTNAEQQVVARLADSLNQLVSREQLVQAVAVFKLNRQPKLGMPLAT